jgi:hypothetical protein
MTAQITKGQRMQGKAKAESPWRRIARKAIENGTGVALDVQGRTVRLAVGCKPILNGVQIGAHFELDCHNPLVAEKVAARFWPDFLQLNSQAMAMGDKAWPEDGFNPKAVLERSHEYEMCARRVAHRRMGRRFE